VIARARAGRLHRRIHIITDEQDALKIECAESHELFWTNIRDGEQDSSER